ncbi:hypothetical protein DFP73DRAFT_598188 [Morchella snyderi]|nr:hypothetical protein DFP73DRAFT_598188 [Morchella snyderi]
MSEKPYRVSPFPSVLQDENDRKSFSSSFPSEDEDDRSNGTTNDEYPEEDPNMEGVEQQPLPLLMLSILTPLPPQTPEITLEPPFAPVTKTKLKPTVPTFQPKERPAQTPPAEQEQPEHTPRLSRSQKADISNGTVTPFELKRAEANIMIAGMHKEMYKEAIATMDIMTRALSRMAGMIGKANYGEIRSAYEGKNLLGPRWDMGLRETIQMVFI